MSEFADMNAKQVHSFALQMGNLGLSRVTDLILSMFESGVWRQFTDGVGMHTFLAGEFDYFLTQQGVTRDHVMHGVRDIAVKARLEEAMDERRTGEPGYRRHLLEVRSAVPENPGHPIEPFGYTVREGRVISPARKPARAPLGRAPRTFRLTSGETTKRPNEQLDRVTKLARAIGRLSDVELQSIAAQVAALQDQRSGRRSAP